MAGFGIGLSMAAVLAAGQQSGVPAPRNREVLVYSTQFAKIPWDVAKNGPLIAACPMAVANGTTLAELRYHLAKVGSVTAIVPDRMVTLNSKFGDSPNLYDGLPRDAKVLYLLTLLSDNQWRKITGDGLSIADCQGQTAAVMQSILPNPLKYTIGTILSHRSASMGDPNSAVALSDEDRRKVRIRVARQLELTVFMANNGGYSGTTVRGDEKPGQKFPTIVESDGDEFGQHIKIESENRLRKNQLNLADYRMDLPVPLVPIEKVSQLVARIGKTTGLAIYSDPHYADMQALEKGDAVPARDILQALAYSVAGTFRRLGNAYVFTNDLEGVAAHQLRIAAWEDDLKKIVEERRTLWRSVLARSEKMDRLKFRGEAYSKLSTAELQNLAVNDKPNSLQISMQTALASDAVQREIREYDGGLKLDPNKVALQSSVRYEVVFPDGSKTWDIGWVGNGEEFTPNPYQWQPPKPKPITLPFGGVQTPHAVALHADTILEAIWSIDRVHRAGISEVWLETSDPASLSAAVVEGKKLGVMVVAAIRPWTANPSEFDPDTNAAGDHGPSFGKKKSTYLALQHFWQDISSYEPATIDSISPLDPRLSAKWDQLVLMANTPGVSQVALLDAYPCGYAQDVNRISGSYWYSEAVDNYLSYGYSKSQRYAFLVAHGVDPVDIENDDLRTDASLRESWQKGWSNGGEFEKWQKDRGSWIHDALLRLVARLASSGKPVLIANAPPKIHIPPSGKQGLSPWKPGTDLPIGFEDYGVGKGERNAQALVIAIREDPDPEQRNRVAAKVMDLIEKAGKQIVLDFSSVPGPKLETLLSRWLR